MTAAGLIKVSKDSAFNVGPYHVVSQDPSVLSETHRTFVVPTFLPQLINIWADIERVTGHRWKCTSYLRQSPSHAKGHAIDLAPHIAPSSTKHYAVYNGSDPVLYKRAPLISALQTLKNKDYSGNGSNFMGIFLEPDHLHVQVLGTNRTDSPTSVIKWGIPKPIYKDTEQRMGLPPTNEGYLNK